MNFKISIILKCFCCLILLASSINSLDNDDNSGEEDDSHSQSNKNEREKTIENQLSELSLELRQSKERDDLLKVEVGKIDKALKELKWTVDEIKLQVNESDAVYERRMSQLSDEINSFKKGNEKLKTEVNAINKALIKNETLKKSTIPFIDFHKCHKSLNIDKDEPTFSWVISDMKKKKMTPESFEIESDIFPLKSYSMKAQVKLEYGNSHDLWCQLSFKENNKSSHDVIDLRLLPSVNYVFRNQTNDIIIRETFRHFTKTSKYDTHYYEAKLIRSTYDVSDTVVIDIYVETPEQAEQSCSDNGTIAWVIHDVSKRRELAKTDKEYFHASPYFYSGPNGYRMVVGMFLNGYGYKRNMGLFPNVVVISGPNDEGLSTPNYDNSIIIMKNFTFLHPTDPAKNIRMPHREYVSYEELESVLLEDTLYYHLSAEIMSIASYVHLYGIPPV